MFQWLYCPTSLFRQPVSWSTVLRKILTKNVVSVKEIFSFPLSFSSNSSRHQSLRLSQEDNTNKLQQKPLPLPLFVFPFSSTSSSSNSNVKYKIASFYANVLAAPDMLPKEQAPCCNPQLKSTLDSLWGQAFYTRRDGFSRLIYNRF